MSDRSVILSGDFNAPLIPPVTPLALLMSINQRMFLPSHGSSYPILNRLYKLS